MVPRPGISQGWLHCVSISKQPTLCLFIGTYIRTSDGRIFAVRATGKPKAPEDGRMAASGMVALISHWLTQIGLVSFVIIFCTDNVLRG
jgi:hypothetical protein